MLKINKVMFITCILVCMMLAISSVSAADNDINELTSNDNDDLNSIDDEILGDDDDGSFIALDTKISEASENSTIILTHDYTWSDSDRVTNGTIINKNLTIDGQNHVIDAKGHDRIFKITGNNVILKNIVFINGKATRENIGQGGAIWWEGSYGMLINCTFKDNYVVSDTYNRGSAGAIWWEGSHGTIVNSTFINNTGDGHNEAGAVYWDSEYGNIENTKFINNSHSNLAGALYIGENGDYTNITNCIFENNTAGLYAGALGLYHKNYIKISKCNFTDNIANDAGGAIYYNYPVEGENIYEVENCIFIGNIANGAEQTSSTVGGGAIYTSKNGKITGSTFIANQAPYYSDGAIVCLGSCEITSSTFINNTAKEGKYSTLTLYGGKIEECIILTNTDDKSVFLTSSVSADYNWWGNTADNYDVKPNALGLNINKWYYLDVLSYNLDGYAYVTLDNVYNSQTKEKYSINSYYCYLPDFSFYLTPKNMTIVTNKVTLAKGEDYYYFEDITFPASITVKNGNVEYTKTITLGEFDLLQKLIYDTQIMVKLF